IGASSAQDFSGSPVGESYVVFGKEDGDAVELSTIASGTGGFVINGTDSGGLSGGSVSGAGDVNGDGLDDLIIGAPGSNSNAGKSYVVFGKTSGTAVSLSSIVSGTGGFVINGIDSDDQSGKSVSGAGDVNGDGLDDLIIGAPNGDPGSNSSAGESYVVFGKENGDAVELSTITSGTGGFVINGIDSGDRSGGSVSGAGDVNGDGRDDLIIGASGANPSGSFLSGESYVVFGKTSGTAVELASIALGADTDGFVINGVDDYDYSGSSVSGAGDVNGDGLDDLIIGAYQGLGGAGESYVVFGKAGGDVVELSTVVAGTGGFVIKGIDGGDESGKSVSGAGDVNGDGLDDLIIGAPQAEHGGDIVGNSYVVFSPGTIPLIVGLADEGGNPVSDASIFMERSDAPLGFEVSFSGFDGDGN
ncbi:MAG TPA: hypothetical protein EYN96_09260, partial [Candidatus Hydrogenedentes bacterium]|nr:hypothetical protein [Candidatus Hydrogenedentota bacterium]